MFKFIKHAFIALFSFSESLTHAAKVSYHKICISLNNSTSNFADQRLLI